MKTVPFAALLTLFALITACQPETGPIDAAGDIRPYAPNLRYWEYRGEPVLLIGGTDDDNLFQWTGEQLTGHLDRLVAAGGNYIRNTMSSRDSGNVWPFHRNDDGLYDLDRLSEEYFGRFETLLRETAARNIIVQIELWDRFDFAREPWLENPYRPANNVNYTVEESGMADEYPNHPGSNDNPFFRSVPAHDDHATLLKYQHAQIDRLLEIALEYPNVLYTMDNETNATAEWGAYWAETIHQEAARRGRTVYTTEMWDAWDLKHEQHRRTLDFPDLYAFADISQNNHNTGQQHWDNLQWVRAYTAELPRPLNHVKIYGADTGRYGTSRDAEERFWRSLIGGAASVRFHRPTSGIGLSDRAQPHLRSAHLLAEEYDFFRADPDVESTLLTDREPNEAYLSFIPGERYAIYFPDGGSIGLNLSGAPGSFTVRWLNVTESRWEGEGEAVSGGAVVSLAAPWAGHWIAHLSN
jgi:hypothetical protein